MEPFIIDVEPTDDSDFVLSSHEGEEFIMVMEGTMEISYGKKPTCSKKVTASITIPSFRTTYTPMKGRQPKYWQYLYTLN